MIGRLDFPFQSLRERLRGRLFAPAFGLAVLALSAWFGAHTPDILSADGFNLSNTAVVALAGLAALALLLLALNKLAWALSLLVFAAATIDVPIGTGTQTSINLAMLLVPLLAVAWLLGQLPARGRAAPLRLTVVRPLFFFVAALFISWLMGALTWDPRLPRPANATIVQGTQVALFILSFGIMLVGAGVRLEERWLKLWTAATVVIAVLGVLAGMFGVSPPAPIAFTQPPLGFGIVLLLAQLLFNPALSSTARRLGWGVMGFWVFITFLTYRATFVGSWAPVAIGSALLVLYRSRRLFAAGIAGLVGIELVYPTLLQSFVETKDSTSSFLRFPIWQDIVRMTLSSPLTTLFGLGPVNYIWYWLNPLFYAQSKALTGLTYISVDNSRIFYAPPAHNMFVDIYAQTGVIGSVLFLWLLLHILRSSHAVAIRTAPGFLRAYVLGVFAGFVGLTVTSGFASDWLIPFVYNITVAGFRLSVYPWLMIGTVLGLHARLADRPPAGGPPDAA